MFRILPSLVLAGLGACAAVARSQSAPVDPELPSVLVGLPGTPGVPTHLHNLNAGFTLTGVHDSADGWYTVVTPAVSYGFRRRYSVDISLPLYLQRLAETVYTRTDAHGNSYTGSRLEPHQIDLGDVLLGGHLYFTNGSLGSTLSASMTLPTGNSSDGLSTGHVTFDLSAHSQLELGRRSALVVDLGGGDSSSLVDPLVTRDYSSLGPLAHFQAGVQLSLPGHSLFQSLSYEQLPLGDDRIYTTLHRRGYPDRTVVSGRSVSEDNGFNNSLSIPLSDRVALHGYYTRSLRLHLDTVGVGLSFALRASQK